MILLSEILVVILAIISFYGFCLFSWWWIKKGSASSVYAYVDFLLLGISIRSIVDAFIIVHPEIIDTWIWIARLLLCFLFVGAIVLHMSYRVFIKGKKLEHYINCLHVWCRLKDVKIPDKLATCIGKKWEKINNFFKAWSDEDN